MTYRAGRVHRSPPLVVGLREMMLPEVLDQLVGIEPDKPSSHSSAPGRLSDHVNHRGDVYGPR